MTARKEKRDEQPRIPDQGRIQADVESAMLKLQSPNSHFAVSMAEKYVYARFEHLKEEMPLTDRQLKDQLDEIHNNGRALLKRLASLRGNYADEVNRCPSTSLDSPGIRTPSFASVMVGLQWLLEATALSDFSGAIKDRHGRDKDTYAFAVAKMAARAFFVLTALRPTGMKAGIWKRIS